MKKELSKDPKSAYQPIMGIYVALILLSIFTRKEFFEPLNKYLINNLCFYLDIPFKTFFADEFSGTAMAAITAIIGIIIPVLISLYESARSTNPIEREYIKFHFHQNNVLLYLVIIFCALISNNNFFTLMLILILAAFIFKKASIYFNLLFHNEKTLVSFLSKSFILKHDEKVHFVNKTVNEIEEIIKKSTKIDDDISFDLGYFSVTSDTLIRTYSKDKLERWIRDLKSSLNEIATSEPNYTANLTSDKNARIETLQKVNVSYDPEDRQISLFLYFSKELHNQIDNSQKYEELKTTFKGSFKNIFFYDESPLAHNDLLHDYEKHIYTALKNQNFVQFSDAINLLEGIAKLTDEESSEVFYKLSRINHSIYNIYNDFECTKSTSMIFMHYWEVFFTASIKFKSNDYVRYALDDLSSAIRNEMFIKKDIKSLERFFTNFYRFQKLNPKFVFQLTNGLIGVSLSLFRNKKEKDAIMILKFISYLRDLENDSKYPIHHYSSNELTKMISTSEQGLVMACAYYLSMIESGKKDEFLRNIFSLITPETFLQTIQDLYSNHEERWDIFSWRVHKFDRHGRGGGMSHSPSHFLMKFLIEYFRFFPERGYLFDKFEINNSSSHFFSEIEREISKENPSSEILQHMKIANEKIKNKNDQEILESKLSKEKVDELVYITDETYKKTFKFSDLINSKTIDKKSDTDSIGIFTLIPKKWINTESDVEIKYFDEYGISIAKGETRAIHELIQARKPATDVMISKFYKRVLPLMLQKSQGRKIVFVGKPYQLTNNHFKWSDLTCKFNPEISITVESLHVSSNLNYIELTYKGQKYKIYKVSTDLSNNYIYFLEEESFELNFLRYEEEKSNSYFGHNNLYIELSLIDKKQAETFISKSPNIVEGASPEEKIKNLQLSVTFKVFSTPQVSNLKKLRSYKLILDFPKTPHDIVK